MVSIVGKSDKYVYRIVCLNCSNELEYVKNDIKSYVSHDYSGGSDIEKYIICPSCNKNVYVK